ncbi:pyridine nucleotide-disulfide oxidoreductase [Sphaerisporangium siamense]|uniref:3-phenylpropionate/trans-cinnamate dioxygenase ferredoxin reductase subunit n=1 Tax=Sphaerisporangium siamense TaxID=795645 RepID=A0A7W7G8S5_9ACTN|nr:FAD-dependent oxidoreductase [Sphaerisporangium siamense]MBB4699819.1 3-phenylpropionate/trans-cinnamate dioxygenase ferredoxin reductase subunit [Sphaerisporangium siamense]GII84861.1 pyridine nucleotide-disulfide oxidoreductase [Sphaerisporangium siamense]
MTDHRRRAGRVVIVGAGTAGVQLADSLRAGGHDGPIVLIGDEPALPYQRPPLSKEYLTGPDGAIAPPLRGESFYTGNDIELRRGEAVTEIDTSRRHAVLDGGERVAYDHLVLATGARNRTLDLPGSGLAGVTSLRTLADSAHLRRRLTTAGRVVVLGAGFVGLEFTAAARLRGVEAVVFETAARPMARVASPALSEFIARVHTEMGTELRHGQSVVEITGTAGAVAAVRTGRGELLETDLVLVCVGAAPADELARRAGITVENGIRVDDRFRTSAPGIWAIGDCASFPDSRSGRRLRLESVQNASAQARVLARVMLGDDVRYSDVPWFWSNQGSIRLQIAGVRFDGDRALSLGDPAGGSFSVLSFREDRLVAVESVNRPRDHVSARRALAKRLSLRPEEVVAGFDLGDLVGGASR